MAARTTGALATALVVLFGLTKVTGQPMTVALLGALITMVSARSVNEPDPHRQHVTMALVPLPAAVSITAAALVTPHPVVGDVLFVVVVFIAVYVRRFGPRGTTLGMVTFMAYFFSLYLRAQVSELPWLIGATVVGTLCSFVWSNYLMPDKPESVLRENIRSLRARMAIVVDRTADLVRNSRTDERSQRRLRIRVVRLNETALTVQAQIEERVNPGALWPGVSGEDLAMWLFNAELTVERLATAGARAAEADIAANTRIELANTVAMLSRAIRLPQSHRLPETAERAQRLLGDSPEELAVSRLALAVVDTAKATAEVRKRIERVESDPAPAAEPDKPEKQAQTGMLPSTRQAVQVAVAAALAIIVGEIVSPSHWYWAAIAAFVIFAGTNTWAETLDKGWQRLLGTVLGVPSGVLVATLVSGNKIASLAMIFVCLFCAFYFMKVTYSLMTFWISTMLALMYGLLGEFTFGLLVLRIEETAVGAVIGIAAAMLVLPINTRTHIRNDAHAFFLTLIDLIDESVGSLLGSAPPTPLTETARQLGRDLQQFRTTAKPLSAGIAGLGGRRTMRHGLRMLNACDRYARILARSSATRVDTSPDLAESIRETAAQIRRNIDVLITALEFNQPATVFPSTDYIDAAESLARQHREESLERRRLLSALHSLRQIDRVVINSAIDLGADNGVLLPR
ncbi:FUSC family protein [Candidatus Mycobacterium wuenschmannii]|uniref:FUSC family protein n=1 Tax=Candidatus Mycobacterium wuenschmannii TaxID=3027808 RepID=A0ABY8W3G8_9MYCO|nr:FUSC family protein [Candidatus Mycobacterium wuenschmannii]WIM90453.1 FUSC family protein [Candidatus Mycobacterium wuenschmannii]